MAQKQAQAFFSTFRYVPAALIRHHTVRGADMGLGANPRRHYA